MPPTLPADILLIMTVGIMGLGRFGAFWASLLAQRFPVRAWTRNDETPTPTGIERVGLEALCQADIVFLCVAMRAVPQALEALRPFARPGCVIADTCSVKIAPARWMQDALPEDIPLLATHPMFGPESAKQGLNGLSIMMDPVRLDEERYNFWADAFRSYGLHVERMSCDQHDREAAYSQALTHFVGRSLYRLGMPDTKIATRWYQKLREVAQQCVRDAPELFTDMQNLNPYTGRMRLDLLHSFAQTLRDYSISDGQTKLDERFAALVDSLSGAEHE